MPASVGIAMNELKKTTHVVLIALAVVIGVLGTGSSARAAAPLDDASTANALPPLPLPGLASAGSVKHDAAAMTKDVPATDPSSQAFRDIGNSFAELFHWGIVLRLLLGMGLSVGCAWVIARHPRRSTKVDPLSDLEEAKTLIVLGLVGAVVAELVTVHTTESGDSMAPYLAFVIFGIGALMRFRTALDNPKSTGKAILVVVIGIACGLNEWALALYVTAAAFALIFWLDSYLACRVNVRLRAKQDLKSAYGAVQEVLQHKGCRVKSSSMYETKNRFVILAHMPAGLDPVALEGALQAALPQPSDGDEVKVQVA